MIVVAIDNDGPGRNESILRGSTKNLISLVSSSEVRVSMQSLSWSG